MPRNQFGIDRQNPMTIRELIRELEKMEPTDLVFSRGQRALMDRTRSRQARPCHPIVGLYSDPGCVAVLEVWDKENDHA